MHFFVLIPITRVAGLRLPIRRHLGRTIMRRPSPQSRNLSAPPCAWFAGIKVVRFARVFMPGSILVEQVKGLLNAVDDSGGKGGVLMRLCRQLQETGCQVTHRVINAADYGSPQLLEMIFIVGMRGIKDFQFPQPTHASHKKITLFCSLKPHISVGEALSGLGKPLQKKMVMFLIIVTSMSRLKEIDIESMAFPKVRI